MEDDKIFEIVEESNEKPELKVATFNICCTRDKEEITETFDAILKCKPDVVAMQGLTKQNCDAVFRIMKQQGYSFSRFDQTGMPREDFETLFTRNEIPVLKKEYKTFIRSQQNKGLSMYLITAGAQTQHPINVWIFTGKLEEDASGNSIRKTQIIEIDAERSKRNQTSVIFAGDTSIPSWQSSDSSFKTPSGWLDAWREKGTSQNEKTSLYDRMDQIWFSSGGERPIEITDFGLIRISPSEDVRAGVCAFFTIEI